jgi:hypothetical protein
MCNFEKLQLSRNTKEYFLKLRFYSQINKSVEIMKNLEQHDENEDMWEVLTDKIEIDDKVLEKYRVMFEDKGVKENYEVLTKCIEIEGHEVESALENINFDKATSWDYIPGEVYKLICKDGKKDRKIFKGICNNLAGLMNQLLERKGEIPEEILCARLLCLNKNPDLNGRLENIRPISILGVLVKIIESIIKARVEIISFADKIEIHNGQIGFVKGLGCDVNLIRIRQKTYEVKRLKTKDEKYIFFIDLKAAYDSVSHRKLFRKLLNKGYPENIVNTIKKLYSGARMRLNTLHQVLNINKGVMQGGILSPWLFNIYIDDLITELKQYTFEVLGYADDLALICQSPKELEDAMNVLEKWSEENEIAINKKKSGILIIDQDAGGRFEIRGYPIKLTYKYLGIKLNNSLSPKTGLFELNKRLDVYMGRNKWIIKKYFTPKSLVTLSMYYQYSRIGYGMSCFLDDHDIIDSVERYSIKYTKAILGLNNQVNSDRLRLILNRPKERYTLWVLLRKTLRKYSKHFKSEAWIFNRINFGYEEWLRKSGHAGNETKTNALVYGKYLEKLDYKSFKSLVVKVSKNQLANELGIKIGSDYYDTHSKYYFMFPDKRDGHLIRYLLDFGFYKNRFCEICKHCGQANSRKHVTNDCIAFDELRQRTRRKLQKASGVILGEDLEASILGAYFNPPNIKKVSEVLDVIKGFSIELIIEHSELEKKMMKEDKDDNE